MAGPADRLDVYLAWDEYGSGTSGCGPSSGGAAWPGPRSSGATAYAGSGCWRDNDRARGFYEHLGWVADRA